MMDVEAEAVFEMLKRCEKEKERLRKENEELRKKLEKRVIKFALPAGYWDENEE